MEAPKLEVIDLAILNFELGNFHYCCHALYSAASRFHREMRDEYSRQFRRSVMNDEILPHWWNSSRPHKRARMAALKAFRQACIDAAKK